jgi:hypothetical protein
VLVALNVGEIKYLNLTKQLGFDEFWNNSGALQYIPHMLHSDRCEMLHASIFNFGLKSMCVIILHTEV